MVALIKSMELFILKVNSSELYLAVFVCINLSSFLAREILPQWDKQIQSLCYQVNNIIEKITLAEPEWIAQKMDEQMIH